MPEWAPIRNDVRAPVPLRHPRPSRLGGWFHTFTFGDAVRRGGMRLVTALTRGTSLPGRLRLARSVNRWIMPPDGYVVSRLANGTLMELDLWDDLQQWFHYLGDYEELERSFLLSHLPRNGVLVDIGANVGLHTLAAARHLDGGGRVIAFEPMTWNLDRLRRNLQLNGLRNVTVSALALMDEAGTATIASASRRSGNASIATAGDGGQSQTITCAALDDLAGSLGIDRIDVVKMDVEGAEHRALRGMKRTLERFGRPPILCEINPTLLHLMGTSEKAFLAEAADLGYIAHRLVEGPRLVPLQGTVGEQEHENVVLSTGD